MEWALFVATVAIGWGVIEFAIWFSTHFNRQQPAPPPSCIGSDPGPQQRAENCCHDCLHQDICAFRSQFTRAQRQRDAARTCKTDPFVPVSMLPKLPRD